MTADGEERALPAAEYLARLEKQDADHTPDEMVLWPRTPIGGDHQDKILERVGVSDLDADDRRSRPSMILRQLRLLRDRGWLPADFSVLDIACGDGLVLWRLKRAFEAARCYGLDCYIDEFDTHAKVRDAGVVLFRGFLQSVIRNEPPEPFDVTLMLNSYRGWESADLRPEEADIPERVDRWFARNSRYTFVTATKGQVKHLRSQGFRVARLGKGENSSNMICISRARLPRSQWWRRLAG